MMLEMRILRVEREGRTMHVRFYGLSWDKDGKMSRRIIDRWANEVCHLCHCSAPIMLKFDGLGCVCQTCVHQFVADEYHKQGF